MSAASNRRSPNWLLRGLIAVSIGIHVIVLAKISGIGVSKQQSYIELEISAEEKPAARRIPEPVQREKALARIETAAPFSSEQREAPSVIAVPDAMLRFTGTDAPKLLDFKPVPPATEKADAKPALETVRQDVSSGLSNDYYRQVLEIIEKNRKYPYAARKLKTEGRAAVRFVIETDGTARDVEIAESSGSSLLDKAALASVAACSPFPEPPAEAFSKAVPLEVGVVFRLNGN